MKRYANGSLCATQIESVFTPFDYLLAALFCVVILHTAPTTQNTHTPLIVIYVCFSFGATHHSIASHINSNISRKLLFSSLYSLWICALPAVLIYHRLFSEYVQEYARTHAPAASINRPIIWLLLICFQMERLIISFGR